SFLRIPVRPPTDSRQGRLLSWTRFFRDARVAAISEGCRLWAVRLARCPFRASARRRDDGRTSRIASFSDVGGTMMFGFRKKAAPPLCKSNPGIGVRAKLALASGDRHWTEELDAVKLVASALKARGYSVRSEKTWLVHAESGFVLLPQLVGLQ